MDWGAEYEFLNRPDSPHPDPQHATSQQTFHSQAQPLPSTSQAVHSSQLQPHLGTMYYSDSNPSSYLEHPLQLESGTFFTNHGFNSPTSTMPHHSHSHYPGHIQPSLVAQPLSSAAVFNQDVREPNAQPARGKRKRIPGGRASTQNKRPRPAANTTSDSSTPSVNCAVGPSNPVQRHQEAEEVENRDPTQPVSDLPLPPTSTPPLRRYQDHPSAATDVWYFLRALETAEEPAVLQLTEEPILSCKPSTPYVGCKLCSKWKVWKLADGMTECYRTHLKKYHGPIYEAAVHVKGLKNSSTHPQSTLPNDEPFSAEKFIELLRRWVVVDDQSIYILECPEFRELLLYLGAGKIDDKDIPHRHKMTDLILEASNKHIEATTDELQRAEGRISFTTDLWSDPCLDSYMAITSMHFSRQITACIESTKLWTIEVAH